MINKEKVPCSVCKEKINGPTASYVDFYCAICGDCFVCRGCYRSRYESKYLTHPTMSILEEHFKIAEHWSVNLVD